MTPNNRTRADKAGPHDTIGLSRHDRFSHCHHAMAFGVLIHRSDSLHDDSPAARYQFPSQYLGRAQASVGDWILYFEPVKVRETRGHFAVAKIQQIIPDPSAPGMFLALIEAGGYRDCANRVAFSDPEGPSERGLLNEAGAISGAAAASPAMHTLFRPLLFAA